MRLFKKGQGATEYLLMLAAVLVIVAIAVYYITTAGAGKPVMTMSAVFDTTDNSIDLKVTAGSLPSTDYQWRILNPDGSVNQDWTDGTTDLSAPKSPIELKKLGTSPTRGVYKVQVYHKPSKSAYEDMPINVSY